MNDLVAYKDELLLLRWSDNSRDGMTVTFQLPGEIAEHPFKHSATGKKTGKRYAAVLVEIGDDEQPVVQEQKPKGGPLSREAAGICKREDFQEFVVCWMGYLNKGLTEEENAAAYIRERCRIRSRSTLDHEKGPAQEFAHIKKQFAGWRP
jgi:hypothetical protein